MQATAGVRNPQLLILIRRLKILLLIICQGLLAATRFHQTRTIMTSILLVIVMLTQQEDFSMKQSLLTARDQHRLSKRGQPRILLSRSVQCLHPQYPKLQLRPLIRLQRGRNRTLRQTMIIYSKQTDTKEPKKTAHPQRMRY